MNKLKIFFISLLIGSGLGTVSFFLSCFLQGDKYNLAFSFFFKQMSLHPLAPGNQLHYRILLPLIGYLTGLKGDHYYILSIIGTILFLTLACFWAYLFYKNWKTAFLLSLVLTGLPVVLYNNVIYGWPDIYCYIFLILAMLDPKVCFIYVLLGVLSHEFFVSYIPFICLYHCRFTPEIFKDRKQALSQVGIGLLVLIIYGLIRFDLGFFHDSDFTVKFYADIILKNGLFSELNQQPLLFGFFTAYGMSFILIPIFIFFLLKDFNKYRADLLLLISAFLPALLLFIAHDTTRFWSNTFIFILLVPRYLPIAYNPLLLFIAISNLLLPSFYVSPVWQAPLNRQADIVYSWVMKRVDNRILIENLRTFDIPAIVKELEKC